MGERRKASDALPPARRAPVPPGRWEGVGSLPSAAHRGHLPPREVSLPPGGQNPITLEYQIYPPTIDSLVTGMVLDAIFGFQRWVFNVRCRLLGVAHCR